MNEYATLQDCHDALSHIRSAPKDSGVIVQLCHRPRSGDREFPDCLHLSVENGIAGDRWPVDSWLLQPDGSPDPRIQVSILSSHVLDLCWRDRVTTPHPGDPLTVDMDLSERNLPVGTHLLVGTAVVEVSDKFNSGCVKWSSWFGAESLRWINLPELRAERLRGILCRVVKDGTVRLGDHLKKVSA
jgi:hypothetical protein